MVLLVAPAPYILFPFVLIAATSALSSDRIVTESSRRSSLRTWGGGKEIGWVVERRAQDNRLEVTVGVPDTQSAEEKEDVLKVNIPRNVDGGVSSSLWTVTVAGAILLRRHKIRSALVDKDILELGSGLGLAGLVAASAPAKSCTLTDKVDAALALLEDTVTRNSFGGCQLTSRRLDWKDTESYGNDQADIVMGAELAYYYFLLQPLMDATKACLNRESGLMYIIGQGNRESQWDLYNNICSGHYNQITDEDESPWQGETKMLLYDLEVGAWAEDGEVGVQGEVPVAVLIHSVEEGRISTLLDVDDHIATKVDEKNQMYTF